jgi:hypothetical protein
MTANAPKSVTAPTTANRGTIGDGRMTGGGRGIASRQATVPPPRTGGKFREHRKREFNLPIRNRPTTGDDRTIVGDPMTGDGRGIARGPATVTAAMSVEEPRGAIASARTIAVAMTGVPTGRRGIRAAAEMRGPRNPPRQATQQATQPSPATRGRLRDPKLSALPAGRPRESAVTMPAAVITIAAAMTAAPTDATNGSHATRNRQPARKAEGEIVATARRRRRESIPPKLLPALEARNMPKEPKENSVARGNADAVVAIVAAESGEEIATGSRVKRPKEERRTQGSRKENIGRLKPETLLLVKKENRVRKPGRGPRRGPSPSNLAATAIAADAAAGGTAGGAGQREEKPVAAMSPTNRVNARATNRPGPPSRPTESSRRPRDVSRDPLPGRDVSQERGNRRHRSR